MARVARRAPGLARQALFFHLTEQPKAYYMHFWANGDPATLASGLRAAVDQTNSAVRVPTVGLGQ